MAWDRSTRRTRKLGKVLKWGAILLGIPIVPIAFGREASQGPTVFLMFLVLGLLGHLLVEVSRLKATVSDLELSTPTRDAPSTQAPLDADT